MTAAPRVRVNQVGYLTDGPKAATLVTDATAPVPWRLRERGRGRRGGRVAAARPRPVGGAGRPRGHVRRGAATGDGFVLEADGATSDPFAIGRTSTTTSASTPSSCSTASAAASRSTRRCSAPGYGRAAGHVDVAPNRGDGAVPCLPAGHATTADGVDLYDGWTGGYTLDVTGGWYDAGDQGKYVVNGGIAVAQLLGLYERALRTGTADALGDGSLRVPERGNGVPDVLDEARWELDWMLRMRVPAGERYAGLVHHKVSDERWVPLPMLPADDPQPRYLHRPSTAATLNLAAVAAQGARLFAPHDEAFAALLRTAARDAYDAAQEHPVLLAPDTNVLANAGQRPLRRRRPRRRLPVGGHRAVPDDGRRAVRRRPAGEPVHARVPARRVRLEPRRRVVAPRSWRRSRARCRSGTPSAPPSSRPPTRSATSRPPAVRPPVRAVDRPVRLGLQRAPPQQPRGAGGARTRSRATPTYRDAVLAGVDYLFGRNALGVSYVTGYGTRDVRNQHSRWYAHQLDPTLPHPPRGTVSGGPNSDCPDPVSAALAGSPAQCCFVDDIGAYGVNEMTINWNSALAWVAAYLAGVGKS